ncbi:MAG: hypothetical protein EOO90_16105 [Pedobacter sp.]|nr:MAG: hypothetical protein EOO90_16105 [Pedobacter sp.]
MNRIIITVGVLLVAMIAMAYLYFSNLQKNTSANDLSLNFVSANAGLVFGFNHDKSFYDILGRQELFQRVLGDTKAGQFAVINKLTSNDQLVDILDGQKIYIGFVSGASTEIDYLICAQAKQNIESNHISKYVSKDYKITKIDNVFSLYANDSVTIYIGIKDNLMVISNAIEQVKKVNSVEGNSTSNFTSYIKQNNGFNKNTLASLYVNFDALNPFLKNLIKGEINGELNVFNSKDCYAMLNYSFSAEKLLFNGVTEVGATDSYYNLFSQLPSQKITIDNLLPAQTANYTVYSVSDYKNWQTELSGWLDRQNKSQQISKNEDIINKKYGLDIKKIFPIYFKNQFVTFQLASGEKLGGISLSNGEKVAQLLLDLSAEYAPDIRVFREQNIPYMYFGEPFKKFEKPFYTIIDNYLVMANHASSIQVFLNSYRNNSLLINNLSYQNFNEQVSDATIWFYINNKNSNTILDRNLKAPYYKQYKSKDGLGTFEAFSYQLSGDKGKFLSNLLLFKSPEKSADTLQKQVLNLDIK